MTTEQLKKKIASILNKPFQLGSDSVYVFGFANGCHFLEDTTTGIIINTVIFDGLGCMMLKKGDQSKNKTFTWKELEALVTRKPVTV